LHLEIEVSKSIKIPIISDARGHLAVIEGNQIVPFEIKRIFYLFGQPPNTTRGGHAHKKAEQFIIAMSGSFTVCLHDGKEYTTHELYEPRSGLYISSMVWVDVSKLYPQDICLVLTSEHYSEDDYIRDFDEFLKKVK